MPSMQCAVCGNQMKLKHVLRFNVYECGSCKLLSSDASFDHSFTSYEDAETRAIGLKQLRISNFEMIIAALKKWQGANLPNIQGLEIGCGIGWWLEMCRQNNITCKGIEPEETFAAYHKQHSLDVAYGFYPAVNSGQNQSLDFIIFNDVFEHIPDIDNLVVALKKDLKNNGLLVVNIPMSEGFFYKVATWLNKLGNRSFLERMWQFNFHSPHMNYFTEKNLQLFMQKHGLECTRDFKLNTLDFKSLKERITTDNSISKTKAFFMTKTLAFLKPVIASSKPDIKVFFFKKK